MAPGENEAMNRLPKVEAVEDAPAREPEPADMNAAIRSSAGR